MRALPRIFTMCALTLSLGLGAQAQPPQNWEELLKVIEAQNLKYEEAHPDWPKGEPAPIHVAKKALEGLGGKKMLEFAYEGVKLTREQFAGQPDAEQVRQIELALDRVLEFIPLIDTHPDGYKNLLYIIAANNADIAYRLYLLRRSYANELPDTLLSLYIQDKFRAARPETQGRLRNIIISTSDDPRIQEEALKAYEAMMRSDLLDALAWDREVQRKVESGDIEVSLFLLRGDKVRLMSDTQEKIQQLYGFLDTLFSEIQRQFELSSTRPEWLKSKMLDFIERTLADFELPQADQHRKFLAEQGRGTGTSEAAKDSPEIAETETAPEEEESVETSSVPSAGLGLESPVTE